VPELLVAGTGGEQGDGRGRGPRAAPLLPANLKLPPRSQPEVDIVGVPRRWGRPWGGRVVAEMSGISDGLHMSADKSHEVVAKLPRSLQTWLGTLWTGGW